MKGTFFGAAGESHGEGGHGGGLLGKLKDKTKKATSKIKTKVGRRHDDPTDTDPHYDEEEYEVSPQSTCVSLEHPEFVCCLLVSFSFSFIFFFTDPFSPSSSSLCFVLFSSFHSYYTFCRSLPMLALH